MFAHVWAGLAGETWVGHRNLIPTQERVYVLKFCTFLSVLGEGPHFSDHSGEQGDPLGGDRGWPTPGHPRPEKHTGSECNLRTWNKPGALKHFVSGTNWRIPSLGSFPESETTKPKLGRGATGAGQCCRGPGANGPLWTMPAQGLELVQLVCNVWMVHRGCCASGVQCREEVACAMVRCWGVSATLCVEYKHSHIGLLLEVAVFRNQSVGEPLWRGMNDCLGVLCSL